MDEVDAAWLAGLYEGEGCLHRRLGGYELVIRMCDEDVVRRAHQLTGLGTVRPHPRQRPNWSDQWRWRVGKREEIAAIIGLIRPWLGQRRGQRADEFLAWISTGAVSPRTPEQKARAAEAKRQSRSRARERIA